MRITRKNLLESKPGEIGFFYSKSHVVGFRNNIENLRKINDDEYHVQNMHDKSPSVFTLDQIISAYGNKKINT